MRWSKLKQKVESHFSAKLRGRIELRLTCYREAHDEIGRGWITVDGEEIHNMCYWLQHKEGEPRIEIDQTVTPPVVTHRGVMSTFDYTKALIEYLSNSIEDSIDSKNYLIRALALIDSRCGKRRLEKLNIGPDEHPLVQRFFQLRCEAEGINNCGLKQQTT